MTVYRLSYSLALAPSREYPTLQSFTAGRFRAPSEFGKHLSRVESAPEESLIELLVAEGLNQTPIWFNAAGIPVCAERSFGLFEFIFHPRCRLGQSLPPLLPEPLGLLQH